MGLNPVQALVAPNAFKGSIDACEAAAAIARGLEASPLNCRPICFPIADGGDGTAELLSQRIGARSVTAKVHGPLGRVIRAQFGFSPSEAVAIIGVANGSGLRLLDAKEYAPLRASSFGTGELIRAALDLGARRILLAAGGSATVDGGVGVLQALGARLVDAKGELRGNSLETLESIDLFGLDPRLRHCALTILCDVDNPLLGADGTTAIFGPQKGATPLDIPRLEAALTRLANVVKAARGLDVANVAMGGSAGGIAAILHGLLGAQLVSGIEHFLDSSGFDAALDEADILFTAEGAIDMQTLHGKAPFGVAARAKVSGVPVVALAGQVLMTPSTKLQQWFDVQLAIGEKPTDLCEAIRSTAANLERTAREVGAALAIARQWATAPSMARA